MKSKFSISNSHSMFQILNSRFFHSRRAREGFTLVELLVAIGVFLITIMVLSQVFIAIVRTEKIAYAFLNSESAIRNNFETVARLVRMGKNFWISNDSRELCFDSYIENNWQKVCYYFDGADNNNFKIGKGGGCGMEGMNRHGSGSCYSPFSKDIIIQSGKFYLKSGTNIQPSVVISIFFEVEVKGQKYSFPVQTAVTPRILNI